MSDPADDDVFSTHQGAAVEAPTPPPAERPKRPGARRASHPPASESESSATAKQESNKAGRKSKTGSTKAAKPKAKTTTSSAKASKPRAKTTSTEVSKREQLGSDQLPRRTLEDALGLARALQQVHAGKKATWEQLSENVELGAKSNNTKYLFWAAVAYGLINKEEEGAGLAQQFSLSEVGRKVVAPTYEGEEKEGVVKALLTPTVLSKFYSEYNGHPVPAPNFLPNVLTQKFGVPKDRTEEAARIILDNARFAGVLHESGSNRIIRLEGVSEATPLPQPVGPPPSAADAAAIENAPTDWGKVCFIITPIGSDDSEERKHADLILKHLLTPIVEESGLTLVRADKIMKQGLITQQIFEYLAKARLCITDLSFNNPNAFYELGIRHAWKLPNVQLIRKGDKIPFDVSQGRTITVDTSDRYTIMDRFESARRELREHLKHFLSGAGTDDDNPVNVYLPGLKVQLPK